MRLLIRKRIRKTKSPNETQFYLIQIHQTDKKYVPFGLLVFCLTTNTNIFTGEDE